LIRIDEPTGINNDLGLIGSPNQPTFYKYNAQGKMVHVIQGKAGEAAIQHRYFLYDYLGRLIRVRQPEQEVNTGNGGLDLTDPVTNNNQWTAGFEYDIVGNLKKTTDAKGSIITNSYDKAGRVTLREYNDVNTPTVFYYYDGTGLGTTPPTTQNYSKGKLTKVMSSISTTQYTSFDNFGRNLVSQQLTDGQTYESKYKYDFGGRLVEQTYPSGKVVRNFFENDGDLAKVVRNGKTYVSDFSYNASGGINSLKLGNGRWETAEFNSRQQLTQLGLGANANDSSLFKLQYEFGELLTNGTIQNTGNITKQTITLPNASFVQTYKYDALDRLTEAKETNGTSATENWKQTFGYDRFGNRTNFSQQINNQALTINSQTLPSVDADTNRFNLNQGFEYDKSGNVIKDIDRVTGLQRSFTFNAENKQVHVKDANNAPVGTYYYDGNGNRVKKSTATETTIFVYDAGGKMVAEYSTVTASQSEAKISYLTNDHLGSPRINSDATGKVVSRRDFMPFGEEIQRANYGTDSVRQKFTGYERDKETGLDFAQARYHNSNLGRFSSADPVGGYLVSPQSMNKYTYVQNNPLNLIDPSGLECADADRSGGGDNCIWVSNGKGLYESLWQSQFKEGNDLFDDKYQIVNPTSVKPFRVNEINNNDANSSNTTNLADLKGKLVVLGNDGNFHEYDPELSVETKGTDEAIPDGYLDINVNIPVVPPIIVTGGAMVNAQNTKTSPYLGIGVGFPGASVTHSPDSVSGGLNYEISGGMPGVGGAFGQDLSGNTFQSTGVSSGFGGSATSYWVFNAPYPKPPTPTGPPTRFSRQNSASNVPLVDRQVSTANCACNVAPR
jgi:RHS repeat-associated protein